jgi:hypothetical protein
MLETVLGVIQCANMLSARFFDSTFALVHDTPVRAATQKRVQLGADHLAECPVRAVELDVL